jgi:riboflavin synthase
MFTGIVTAIGTVDQVTRQGDTRAVIACPWDPANVAIGASIACSGVCLTVVERGGQAGAAWFAVDISDETVSCTVPGMWVEGQRLNLEPALRLGDELGGHIVTGHVDAVGEIVSRDEVGGSARLVIRAAAAIAPYLAAKGSITVEGVSLTVNDFALNIIPHTGEVTTLGALRGGDAVNLEIDVLARYLKRMQSLKG